MLQGFFSWHCDFTSMLRASAVPVVFYSSKSRCLIVISTVSSPFSLGVQPSKPRKVKPCISMGTTHECHHCNRDTIQRATLL
ncbi:hypothetical protein C4K39_0590 [Pseudomonas sessilinigenes]|nr:hypothetical protein C4K39_0590 [Pseudomonas sessilinigenes]